MHNQRGLSFIEVLVAFVILTVGILGAVAMQASAQKASFDAMQRSIASALAQDIIERMRGNNSDLITLEAYEGVYGDNGEDNPELGCDSVANLCTPDEMRQNDLYEWEQLLQGSYVTLDNKSVGGLVGARGCIQHADHAVEVIVSWQAKESTQDNADNSDSFEFDCGEQSDKRQQVFINAFVY